MKKVLAFMLGMATTIVAIKLVTKVGDNYDNWEDDDMFFYNSDDDDFMAYYGFKHPKALETPAQKAERERKQARKALLAEQDYWLAQLSDALSTQNEADKAEANENLQRIVSELGAL